MLLVALGPDASPRLDSAPKRPLNDRGRGFGTLEALTTANSQSRAEVEKVLVLP